jgi:hypothetical protein
MQANQLRLWFSAMAYVLLDTLRRVAPRHTQFADAAITTIRLKLLKIGAPVRTSVRRIQLALATGCPNQQEFAVANLYLRRAFGSARAAIRPRHRQSDRSDAPTPAPAPLWRSLARTRTRHASSRDHRSPARALRTLQSRKIRKSTDARRPNRRGFERTGLAASSGLRGRGNPLKRSTGSGRAQARKRH